MLHSNGFFSIGAVAQRTGLTPATIRTWETRHSAVTPDRTPSGQRIYSEGELERILLMKRLVDSGQRIGLIASLTTDELIEQVDALPSGRPRTMLSRPDIEGALEAVRAFDREGLRAAFEDASVEWGQIAMLERFLAPLMTEVGELWAAGTLRMAHEHLATAEAKAFVDQVMGAYPPAPGAPALVAGTPVWQHHEVGALMAAAAARAAGWRSVYVGPNLPASELATAAIQVDAIAIALSIAYVDDPAIMFRELRQLRRLAPDETRLIVGGAAAEHLETVLDEIGATRTDSLEGLRRELVRLRAERLAG